MDLKTLRLASIALDPGLLDQFVTYQRTLLVELGRSTETEWSGRYAFAHSRALAASRMDLLAMGKVKAMVSEFCGRRSALRQVTERLAQTDASQPKGRAIRERAEQELPRLRDLGDLQARYGADAVALLTAREDELLGLHRELARVEGGAGHLHSPG